MKDKQKQELVEALLKCRSLAEQDRRDAVVNDLPDDIRTRIRRSDVPQLDVTNAVDTCLEFPDGLNILVKIVHRYEGDSIPMRKVSEVLSGPAPRPGLPSSSRAYVEHDDDVWIGREIHWDREPVVAAFVGMIKGKSEHPWRVLGIQGPRDADIDSLVDRLAEMCNQMCARADVPRPMLYARILLRPGIGSAHSVALEVLSELRRAAEHADQEAALRQAERFRQAWDDIDRGSGGEPGQRALSERQIARKLTDCLEQVAQQYTVVLLLQRFEQVLESPSGKWLRDVWLIPEACNVSGLAVVATSERGLGELVGLESKGILCFDRLPPMTWQDFASWAREGCHLEWITDDFAQVLHREYRGSTYQFAIFLRGAKMFGPMIMDRLVSHQG